VKTFTRYVHHDPQAAESPGAGFPSYEELCDVNEALNILLGRCEEECRRLREALEPKERIVGQLRENLDLYDTRIESLEAALESASAALFAVQDCAWNKCLMCKEAAKDQYDNVRAAIIGGKK